MSDKSSWQFQHTWLSLWQNDYTKSKGVSGPGFRNLGKEVWLTHKFATFKWVVNFFKPHWPCLSKKINICPYITKLFVTRVHEGTLDGWMVVSQRKGHQRTEGLNITQDYSMNINREERISPRVRKDSTWKTQRYGKAEW